MKSVRSKPSRPDSTKKAKKPAYASEPISIEDEATSLTTELQNILRHERAEDVFTNGWLHDEEIPMPSTDLILALAMRFASGTIMESLAIKSLDDVVREAVAFLRSEDEEKTFAIFRDYLSRIRTSDVELNESQNWKRHEWWSLMEMFLFPDPTAQVEIQAAQRYLARRFLETLFLRAVYTFDSSRVRDLSKVLEMISKSQFPDMKNSQKIAAAILRDRALVEKAAGRPLSKHQLKDILTELYDDLPTDETAWQVGFRLISFPPRRRKNLSQKEKAEIVLKLRNRFKTNFQGEMSMENWRLRE